MSAFSFMPEIEDEIFQWATVMSPPDAPTFSIISKRVQPLVEAIMYETLTFISYGELFLQPNMTYAERFEPTLRARSTEFFARSVYNVCITNSVPRDIAALILAKCTGIRNLAVWQYRDPMKLDTVKLINTLSSALCSLSVGRYILRRLADCGYMFPSLKYLTVGILPLEMDLPTLEWVPVLATVRLRLGQQPVVDDQWMQDVRIVISTAPQLQALLLDVNGLCIDDVLNQVTELNDGRIAVRDEDSQSDPIAEWREAWA